MAFSSQKQVFYQQNTNGQVTSIQAGIDNMQQPNHTMNNSICRFIRDSSSSVVRLSYPYLDQGGRTGAALITAEVQDETGDPKISPLTLLQASTNYRSILYMSFIDLDAYTAYHRQTSNAMFYWIEGNDPAQECSSSGGCVKYRSTKKEQSAFAVLLDGSSLTSNLIPLNTSNGKEYPTALDYSGDYAYGGSYSVGDKLYFLAHWSEGSRVAANLVEVDLPASGLIGSTGSAGGNHPVMTCQQLKSSIASLQYKQTHGGLTTAQQTTLKSEEGAYWAQCVQKTLPPH